MSLSVLLWAAHRFACLLLWGRFRSCCLLYIALLVCCCDVPLTRCQVALNCCSNSLLYKKIVEHNKNKLASYTTWAPATNQSTTWSLLPPQQQVSEAKLASQQEQSDLAPMPFTQCQQHTHRMRINHLILSLKFLIDVFYYSRVNKVFKIIAE